MSYPTDFLELARISPWFALIRVHDRIWKDKTGTLEERCAACQRVCRWLIELTIIEAEERLIREAQKGKAN